MGWTAPVGCTVTLALAHCQQSQHHQRKFLSRKTWTARRRWVAQTSEWDRPCSAMNTERRWIRGNSSLDTSQRSEFWPVCFEEQDLRWKQGSTTLKYWPPRRCEGEVKFFAMRCVAHVGVTYVADWYSLFTVHQANSYSRIDWRHTRLREFMKFLWNNYQITSLPHIHT